MLAGQACQPRSCCLRVACVSPRSLAQAVPPPPSLVGSCHPLISLGVIPRGQPLGPPHHHQRGHASHCFRPSAWFRKPSPAQPLPGFRVKPVLKVLAGIRKPSYLPIEAMPLFPHPNNIQNAGQVGRGAMGGMCRQVPSAAMPAQTHGLDLARGVLAPLLTSGSQQQNAGVGKRNIAKQFLLRLLRFPHRPPAPGQYPGKDFDWGSLPLSLCHHLCVAPCPPFQSPAALLLPARAGGSVSRADAS